MHRNFFLPLGMVNEIRIGNIIGINKIPKDFEISSGEHIVSEKLLWTILYFETVRNALYPISLSEEWMLKFGFNIEECFYFNNGVWLELLEDFEFRIEGFDLDNKIKYVHQLQNLYFSLTGEELVLKEFAK